MSTAEERLQAMMAKRKKEKEKENIVKTVVKEEKKIQRNIKDIFSIEDSVFNSLTDDVDLIEYLKNKSMEMLQIQGNNIIQLGKNLSEVSEELGRKGSPEGLYLKYLEFNGYKKDTALRLRKRYELFNRSKNEIVRQIISILPVRSVEILYKEKELFAELEKKGDTLNYNITTEIINKHKEKIEIKMELKNEEFNFNVEKLENLYKRINSKYEELDLKKREKINKLLSEIEKLLS